MWLRLLYKQEVCFVKRFVGFLLVFVIILFTGCMSDFSTRESKSTSKSVAAVEQSEEDTVTSDTHIVNETPEEKTINTREIIDKYAKVYDTHTEFSDMYVAEKHLLIGDETIVELFVIGDFCDVVSISRKDIERIEHSAFEEFACITIYDKTKQTISLTVAPDIFNNILEILN